ncbi:MAG: DNA-3-methyladenine glycosylase 2 family protein [Pseudomonadota bacterium]
MAPDYWPRAKRALARRDAVLARIMRAHRRIALARRGEPFKTLARSIVGQQISVKAADSVWNRVLATAPAATPEQILKARRRLRACGLSQRKAEYIADLARHFADGTLHARDWPDMDDETVIAELIRVRGIGRWTAEMFLIFNLLRPDVLPLDDLGLQRAIGLHYFAGERVAREQMRELGASWSPWRSVATWYLWRSLDPMPVEY